MNQTIPSLITPSLSRRINTFLHAMVFILGFSLVFIVGWGGAASTAGRLFGQYKTILGQIGGVIVIVFGLATFGVLKIPWLYYDTRPDWNPNRRSGLISSGLMGVFFAAGWTPCIGTTLGAILTLGFSQQTVGQAMVLSSGYAIGLGLPFLAIGLAMDRAFNLVRRLRRYQRGIQIFSGIFLVVIGAMLLTGRLTLIAIWAQRNGYFLDLPLGGASVPSYLIAILAGLISFLSPCVLPLVPAYVGYLSGQSASSVLKHDES
ncbi:MAG TPA: cytochrome c biogenesis protein CcdA [Anaerolineales bacterium]|nr:cytochrome c biogenesis protein CcdA [Anaerolineales bacterium]